jgi:pimeloyl-ACP methyl ester carboxylesterase
MKWFFTLHKLLRIVAFFVFVGILHNANAQIEYKQIGIVVMHGSGGKPTGYVYELATALKGKGYQVANLEMPWSGRRAADVTAEEGAEELSQAIKQLQKQGAQAIFLAGHSFGGTFALYYAGLNTVNGVIAIAPGGIDSDFYQSKIANSLAHARQLIAEGRGDQKEEFANYENSRGDYTTLTPAKAYVSWYSKDSVMNASNAFKRVQPNIPVLYIVPSNDYLFLRRAKAERWAQLPPNPKNELFEPIASHLEAPTVSINEIIKWINMVDKDKN